MLDILYPFYIYFPKVMSQLLRLRELQIDMVSEDLG